MITLILDPGGPIDCKVMPDAETTLSKEQVTLFRIQYDLLVAKLAKEKAAVYWFLQNKCRSA